MDQKGLHVTRFSPRTTWSPTPTASGVVQSPDDAGDTRKVLPPKPGHQCFDLGPSALPNENETEHLPNPLWSETDRTSFRVRSPFSTPLRGSRSTTFPRAVGPAKLCSSPRSEFLLLNGSDQHRASHRARAHARAREPQAVDRRSVRVTEGVTESPRAQDRSSLKNESRRGLESLANA